MSTTPPAPTQRAAIKVWGTPNAPRWSVTVYLGDRRAELFALVDLALDTHAFVGQRLAERRRAQRPAPTVHVPPRQEAQ